MAGNNSTRAAARNRGSTGGQGSTNPSKPGKQNRGGSNNPPTAVGRTIVNRGPRTTRASDGSVSISNTEFVADFSSQAGVSGFDLNPASAGIFTWLSRIAQGYELFRFTELEFIYTPVCSSSTSGVVVMAFDYDASDEAPATKQALSAYAGSVRGNVWNTLRCKLEPPPGWFFTGLTNAQTINPPGTDIKFYDTAKFYFGTYNYAGAGIPLGELSVRYVVQFSKPDFGPPAPIGSSVAFASSVLSTPVGGATQAGNVPLTLSSDPTTRSFTLTFGRAGQFMVEIEATIVASSSTFGLDAGAVQTDPGASASTTIGTVQRSAFWVNASTSYQAEFLYPTSALAGTAITFVISTAVTAFSMTRLRIMSFPKSLA